jgi:hypothetical protein
MILQTIPFSRSGTYPGKHTSTGGDAPPALNDKHSTHSRTFLQDNGKGRRQDLNPRPAVYKTAALPTELLRQTIATPNRPVSNKTAFFLPGRHRHCQGRYPSWCRPDRKTCSHRLSSVVLTDFSRLPIGRRINSRLNGEAPNAQRAKRKAHPCAPLFKRRSPGAAFRKG